MFTKKNGWRERGKRRDEEESRGRLPVVHQPHACCRPCLRALIEIIPHGFGSRIKFKVSAFSRGTPDVCAYGPCTSPMQSSSMLFMNKMMQNVTFYSSQKNGYCRNELDCPAVDAGQVSVCSAARWDNTVE